MQVLQRYLNYDLDPFYANVKFGQLCFCIVLETVAALGLKVGRSIQLNELIDLSEYQRSRSFLDLGQRYSAFRIKTFFPETIK